MSKQFEDAIVSETENKPVKIFEKAENQNYLSVIRSNMLTYVNGIIPKCGIISLCLERTPVILLRDLDKIMGCDTACTDGVHIFFNESFLETLIKEERISYDKEKNRSQRNYDENLEVIIREENLEKGTEFVLMHECYHIIMRHLFRPTFKKYFDLIKDDPSIMRILNIATDMKINTNLQLGFPKMKIVNALKGGVGFNPSDIKTYPLLSEEEIMDKFLAEYLQRKQDYMKGFGKKSKSCDSGSQKGSQGETQDQNQEQNESQDQNQNQNQNQDQNQEQEQGEQDQGKGKGKKRKKQDHQNQDGSQDQDINEKLKEIYEKHRKNKGKGDGKSDAEDFLDSEAFYSAYQEMVGSNPSQSERDAMTGVKDSPYLPNKGRGKNPISGQGDDHILPIEEVVRRLTEAKREDVLDRLRLPKDTNSEEGRSRIDKLRQQSESNVKTVINKSIELAKKHPSLPGQHIAESAEAYVQIELQKKLNWRFFLKKLIFGDGVRTERDFGMPDIIFYNEDVQEVLGMPYWEEDIIPQKNNDAMLILVDTSGSMYFQDAIGESLNEIFSLQARSKAKDSAEKVFVIWADTVIRSKPILVTKDNYKDYIKDNKVAINGGGGTDIIGCLHESLNTEVLKREILKKHDIKDVVVFTDLEFGYDSKGLRIPRGTSVSFIAPECVHKELVEGAKKAMPWANVFHIGHDKTVDLKKATRITEELAREYFGETK